MAQRAAGRAGARGLAACFWTGLLAWLVAGSAVAGPDAAELLTRRIEAARAPAAVFAHVRDGEVYTGAVQGPAGKGRPAPDPQTPVPIGSVSKVFTALAVLQLVEAGDLSLDAPVSGYLPWLKVGQSGAEGSITPRQLLSHTSGLSTLDGNRTQTDQDTGPGALRRRVEVLARARPQDRGARYAYSNANYQILGALIEEVSGLSYETYVDQRLFQPLGMRRSFVIVPTEGLVPATGHYLIFGQPVAVRGQPLGLGAGPQGGISASAGDLGLFLKAILDGHPALPGPDLLAEMMTPQPSAPRYGLGIMIGAPGNPEIRHHGGQSPGFDALIALDLQRREAIAVVTNAGPGFLFGPTHGISYGTVGDLMGLPDVPAGSPALNIWLTLLGSMLGLGAVAASIWQVRRRPSGLVPRVLLSLFGAFLILCSAALLIWLPSRLGVTLGTIWLFQPDAALVLCGLAMVFIICAVMILIGSIGRMPTSRWVG